MRPDLAAEWADKERAAGAISYTSTYRATWLCNKGHVYLMDVNARTNRARGCPICSGKQIVPGINDLMSLRPEVATEWDDDRPADTVSVGSDYEASWRCPMGHTWKMRVYRRTREKNPQGCPYCAGRRISVGVNDLATLHPDLSTEWNDSKDITAVGAGSHYRANWKCSRGHQWRAEVRLRAQGRGACLQCSSLGGQNPHLTSEWDDERDPYSVMPHSKYRAQWRCEKGHRWVSQVDNRSRGSGCPVCYAKQFTSRQEREVVGYIRSLYKGAVETTVRRFPGIVELDIYLPEKHIAIEVNGVYSHSEANGRGQRYHADKLAACEALGIRLIQVWQDDWAERRPIVERMLAHKLGVSNETRIAARSTTARKATTAEAREFLNANHIQGFTGATHHLGLEHQGQLVALMSLKRTGKPGELRLERYATAAHVLGGQSKLIRYAERTIPGWTHLITFADREVSDGSLYEHTGWVKDGELAPDYKYLVRSQRVHKFNFRLTRFRDDPALEYDAALSERQLAELNGLPRVWDSGKTRYRYNLT